MEIALGMVAVLLLATVIEGLWLYSRGAALAEERARRELAEVERDVVTASYESFRRQTKALLGGDTDARSVDGDHIRRVLRDEADGAGAPTAPPGVRGAPGGGDTAGGGAVPPATDAADRRRVS